MPPVGFNGAALGGRDQRLPERMRQDETREGRGKAFLKARQRPLVLLVSPIQIPKQPSPLYPIGL